MNLTSEQNDNFSLRVKVFHLLEDAIISGKYNDGDSLNELKLSQELGVSRTPIREAIMQLELEGLVKNIPNKGAIVVNITKKDVVDIYLIRIQVEGLAAQLCARNINEDELKVLEGILDLQDFYLSKLDIAPLWQLDGEFHKVIYECTRNRPLKSMLTSYHNYIQRARVHSIQVNGRAKKCVAEHRAILNAIKNHDESLASQLMTEHIRLAMINVSSHDTE
jgi:DNA-binding GntR family transcriptional regulator